MKNYILTLVIFFLQTSVALPQIDTWTQITGDGFGFPSQTTVPEMEVFNGYLYASTSPTDPGLATLWRTATGDSGSWSAITNYTPSLNADGSIHTFGTTSLGGGYMWFGTGNGKVGTIIYQSQDGENWTAISKRGFGNKLLTGAAPHMVVFKASNDSSYLYAGAGSHGEGTAGQVWRTYYTNTDSTKWELLIDFASIDTGVQTITYFYVWNNTLYLEQITEDNYGNLLMVRSLHKTPSLEMVLETIPILYYHRLLYFKIRSMLLPQI
ncbi:MAG: hypothetical protein JKY33_09005 [Bacteroidia bacterium]|nr:hypothetical protein [Bacteroidia bacterium]